MKSILLQQMHKSLHCNIVHKIETKARRGLGKEAQSKQKNKHIICKRRQ